MDGAQFVGDGSHKFIHLEERKENKQQMSEKCQRKGKKRRKKLPYYLKVLTTTSQITPFYPQQHHKLP